MNRNIPKAIFQNKSNDGLYGRNKRLMGVINYVNIIRISIITYSSNRIPLYPDTAYKKRQNKPKNALFIEKYHQLGFVFVYR